MKNVRRVAPRSVEGVLVEMVPMLLQAEWSPVTSAERLVAHVRNDARPLRETRVHLLASTATRTTLVDLRAIATLNLAISRVESASQAVSS